MDAATLRERIRRVESILQSNGVYLTVEENLKIVRITCPHQVAAERVVSILKKAGFDPWLWQPGSNYGSYTVAIAPQDRGWESS